ncbi:hypothetical protein ACG33_08835 [Steroidobacter denitrificans]|uniref:HNH domain-containing protein n=1 Tax=Steroidobacter denitrificans TaxID=465721 RepID=A0A127F9V4_STEDE|nr:hypothetical protein ACG33_08835 [Steroidobacter denitrificans]
MDILECVRRFKPPSDGCCFYCDAPYSDDAGFERDHFPVPASAGGEWTVWACAKCHQRKDRAGEKEQYAWAEDQIEEEHRTVLHNEGEWAFIYGRCAIIDPTTMFNMLDDLHDFRPRVRVLIAAQLAWQVRAMHARVNRLARTCEGRKALATPTPRVERDHDALRQLRQAEIREAKRLARDPEFMADLPDWMRERFEKIERLCAQKETGPDATTPEPEDIELMKRPQPSGENRSERSR